MNYHIQTISANILCYVRTHGGHARFTKKRWVQDVRQGNTELGYAEWVLAQVQAEFIDHNQEVSHVGPSIPTATPQLPTLGQ